jgi:prevent-host-death family protein
MKIVTFTEFRRNASVLLSAVEQGESLLILRHGKPIAEINPVAEKTSTPAWKEPALRLASKGIGLSAAILEERVNEI